MKARKNVSRFLAFLLALVLMFTTFTSDLMVVTAEGRDVSGDNIVAEEVTESVVDETDAVVADEENDMTLALETEVTSDETDEDADALVTEGDEVKEDALGETVPEVAEENEEVKIAEEMISVVEVNEETYPAVDFESATANGKVKVSASAGAFPAGTTMKAVAVLDNSSVEAAAAALDEEVSEEGILVFDISFFDKDNTEIDPLIPISVIFELDELKSTEVEVFHIDPDVEEGEELEATQVASNVYFDEESEVVTAEVSVSDFSWYILKEINKQLLPEQEIQEVSVKVGEQKTFYNYRAYSSAYAFSDYFNTDWSSRAKKLTTEPTEFNDDDEYVHVKDCGPEYFRGNSFEYLYGKYTVEGLSTHGKDKKVLYFSIYGYDNEQIFFWDYSYNEFWEPIKITVEAEPVIATFYDRKTGYSLNIDPVTYYIGSKFNETQNFPTKTKDGIELSSTWEYRKNTGKGMGNGEFITISESDAVNYVYEDNNGVKHIELYTNVAFDNSISAFFQKDGSTVDRWTYGDSVSLLVEQGETDLLKKQDHTETYFDSNNNKLDGQPTAVGSYSVKVTLKENDYYGAKSTTINFTIDPKDVSDVASVIAENVEYDGAEHKNVTVKVGETELTEGTDYTVTYDSDDYINVGEKTIGVTFSGNYTGSKTANFNITAKKLTASFDRDSFVYNGEEQGPAVILEGVVGEEVVNVTTVGTVKATDAGEYSFNVTGIADNSNYTIDETSCNWEITRKALSNATAFAEKVIFNGCEQTPAVTVKDGDVTLVENRDYTVTGYVNNMYVGGINTSHYATVEFINNYKGSANAYFDISPYDVNADYSTVTYDFEDGLVYNGQEQKPVGKVYFVNGNNENVEINPWWDVEVSYENNINASDSAKAVITFKNNFTGTITEDFSIQKAEGRLELKRDNASFSFIDGHHRLVYGKDLGIYTVKTNLSKGDITWEIADKAIAEVVKDDKDSNKLYIRPLTKGGKTTIKFTSTDRNGNYTDATQEITIRVKNGKLEVVASDYSTVYDGNNHTINYTPAKKLGDYSDYAGSVKESFAKVNNPWDVPQNWQLKDTLPTFKDAGTYYVYYKVECEGYTTETGVKKVEIQKRPIEVTWSDKNTFTYSGETFTYEPVITNLVENDSVGLVYNEGNNLVDANGYPWQHKAVKAGNYTSTFWALNGRDAKNYTMPKNNDDTWHDWTITQKELTISWNGNKAPTYNGTAHKFEATLNDVVNGDDVKPVYNTEAHFGGYPYMTEAVNAGNYTASVCGLTGKDADNYKIKPYTNTWCNWEIKKAPLTIEWPKNNSLVYDGTLQTYKAILSGIWGSDKVNPVYQNENVWRGYLRCLTESVNCARYIAEVVGVDNPNYTIDRVNNKTHEWEVTQRPLTINWSGKDEWNHSDWNFNFKYSEFPYTISCEFGNVANADRGKITPILAGNLEETNVGNYTAKVTGINGELAYNYKLPRNTVRNWSISYINAWDAVAVPFANRYGWNNTWVSLSEFGYKIRKISDDGKQTWAPALLLTDEADEGVVEYRLQDTTGYITDVKTFNYKIDYTKPTADVTINDDSILTQVFRWFKKDSAVVKITAEDNLSGVKSIEWKFVGDEEYSDYNDLTGIVVDANKVADIRVKVTDYADNVFKCTSDNIVVYTDAEALTQFVDYYRLSVEDKEIKVNLNENTINEVTGNGITPEDYTIGEDGTITLNGEFLETLPGRAVPATDEDGLYTSYIFNVSYNPLGIRFVVEPEAEFIVDEEDLITEDVVYIEDNRQVVRLLDEVKEKELAPEVYEKEFAFEEDIFARGDEPATTSFEVRVYKNANTGSFTVTDKVYDQTAAAYTYSIANELVEGTPVSVLYANAGSDTWTAAAPTGAGSYTAKLVVSEDANYYGFELTDDYTIARRPASIGVFDETKTVGDSDPEWRYDFTGFLPGDSDLAWGWRDSGETAGTYTIHPNVQHVNPNYDITSINGTLTIEEAPAVVLAAPLGGGGGAAITTVANVEEEVAEISEEEVPEVEAPEIEEVEEEVPAVVEIPEEEVPEAVAERCIIHWLVLADALLYAMYSIFRVLQNKEELSDEAESVEN